MPTSRLGEVEDVSVRCQDFSVSNQGLYDVMNVHSSRSPLAISVESTESKPAIQQTRYLGSILARGWLLPKSSWSSTSTDQHPESVQTLSLSS